MHPAAPSPLPLPPQTSQPADLRVLLHAIGPCWQRTLPPAASWRPQLRFTPDGQPCEVAGGAASPSIAAAIDGVQRTTLLTLRQHRPITLVQVGAAAYGPAGCLAIEERIAVLASQLDHSFVDGPARNAGVPVVLLPAVSPQAVRWHTDAAIRDFRTQLEHLCTETAVKAANGKLILVDGSIRTTGHLGPGLVGVVKSTDSVHEADTDALYRLKPGWISRPFQILPDTLSEQPVWSAYLRLHEPFASHTFGLVRLETADASTLLPAATACFEHRQPLGADDPRADRHLAPVREVEEVLKARLTF